jgi:hypothetical protein
MILWLGKADGSFDKTSTTGISTTGTSEYVSVADFDNDGFDDFAEETAELTKQQILQQASVSVLGQANVNLQLVLELLAGVN